jgi:hypothetical protein
MAKASGANRLRPSHLRVLQGGMRCPLEKIEARVTDRRKAGALMRAAIAILLLPVALSGALVASVYLHIESVLDFTLPLVAACAVLAALGAGLVAYALHLLGQGEHRPLRSAEKSDWCMGRHTG